MVRKYKRQVGARRYRDYTEEQLEIAVRAVRQRGISYQRAAELFNIPKRTIYNKVKNRHRQAVGAPIILDPAEERHFVDLLIASAEYGFPLTMLDLRMIVQEYLNRIGRKIQKFTDNLPGKDWCYRFLERHKRLLSQRTCQNIKGVRAQATDEAISEYFERLETHLHSVPPSNILNYDETNLSDDPGRKRCIFRRGTKYPERILNSTKAAISIMFAATASGELLPPYVVYKAERLYDKWCIGGPQNARYNRTKSGWFDGATFSEWFNTLVVPWARKLTGTKVVIGDNLSSHLNIEILRACQRLDIKFIFLPAHTSHLTQPLDVGFFRSLKGSWRDILTEYKVKNPKETTLNKMAFPVLLSKLLDKMNAKDKTIIKNAFKASGIYPLNKTEVTKKLPKTKVQRLMEEKLIDESVLNFLREKRSPLSQPQTKQRKKMLKVPPGQSISYEDLLLSGEDISGAGLSSHPNRKNTKERRPEETRLQIQDSDEEAEDQNIVEDEEIEDQDEDGFAIIPARKKPEKGDYLVIKFATKKNIKHFIGLILAIQDDGSYDIKYMRKKRGNIFIFPIIDDLACAFEQDIEIVLHKPTICRDNYEFSNDLTAYKL